MSEIVLGISGSIAAYKAAELCRLLMKRGHNVSVVMTQNATRFITPLTMQTLSKRPVALDQFVSIGEWQPNHIALAQRADLFIVAPATANVIAKLACGIADDELTSTALACRAPVVVAPAMNDAMYEHPATQENIAKLRARGVVIVSPDDGELACGTSGRGRLAELEYICAKVDEILSKEK